MSLADLVQRRCERFDVRVTQVCVLSYFGDGNVAITSQLGGGLTHRMTKRGASRPNWAR